MGVRVPVLVLALSIAACDRPPATRTHEPDDRPPGPAAPPPVVRADPPPAAVAPPAPLRFVTPANPDVAPQAPMITRARGKPRRQDLGGGWTVTIEPAEISAAPGEEIEFTIELRSRKPGSGRPELSSGATIRWPDIQQRDRDEPSHWLPLQGGRTRGVLLARPHRWSDDHGIRLVFRQRQRPGSLGHAATDGPRLTLDNTTIVPVELRHLQSCDLPDGLAVTVDGRQVTAYFSRVMGSGDHISPRGEFVVRRIAGRLTLVAFVDVYYTDIGSVAPRDAGCPHLHKPDGLYTSGLSMHAVAATFTTPGPGPIDIIFYATNSSPGPRHATAVLVE